MTEQVKIVRTDQELECPHVDKVLRDKGFELVLLPDGVDEDRLAHETRDADLILMCYTPIPAAIIENAVKLKGIVKYGVGIDAIDIDTAKARGIPVVNIPEYAEETVAEGAFMLMIALAKRLIPLQSAMQRDGWAWPNARWLASDLAEKTVGLVGTGRIGCSMARMAGAGFRARILGYDPNVGVDSMRVSGIEKFDDLHAMLEQCDFVSIHSVLNDDSRHLIGERELASMKASAFLINVSRGAIVDEAALLAALKSGAHRGRRPRCLQRGTVVKVRPSARRTLCNGKRRPVSPPDLLHRGGDAPVGRRNAATLFRNAGRSAGADQVRRPAPAGAATGRKLRLNPLVLA